MVLDQREHYLTPIRTVLTAAVAPMQYMVDIPVKFTGRLNINLTSHETLLTENASLRANQLLLQAKLQRLVALETENKQLRALLKSSPAVENQRIAVAQLLAVSTDPVMSEVVLDKGKNDDVYVGQPVVDANGVMGQIIQVGLTTSRVLLITDLRSAVPVQDARDGVRGIVIGQGNLAPLALTDIPDTVDVQVGDLLISSGLGGHYPAGYPVGVVSKVQHDSGEQFTNITVRPNAQLSRNQQVLLIWPPLTPTIDVPQSLPITPAPLKAKNGNNK